MAAADAHIAALSDAELGDYEKLLELRDQQVLDGVVARSRCRPTTIRR